MTDIIKEIYKERFFGERPLSEEYRALEDKDSALWQKVRPLLGRELIDQMQNSQADITYQTNYEWFREGFRLGASLMPEVYQG